MGVLSALFFFLEPKCNIVSDTLKKEILSQLKLRQEQWSLKQNNQTQVEENRKLTKT